MWPPSPPVVPARSAIAQGNGKGSTTSSDKRSRSPRASSLAQARGGGGAWTLRSRRRRHTPTSPPTSVPTPAIRRPSSPRCASAPPAPATPAHSGPPPSARPDSGPRRAGCSDAPAAAPARRPAPITPLEAPGAFDQREGRHRVLSQVIRCGLTAVVDDDGQYGDQRDHDDPAKFTETSRPARARTRITCHDCLVGRTEGRQQEATSGRPRSRPSTPRHQTERKDGDVLDLAIPKGQQRERRDHAGHRAQGAACRTPAPRYPGDPPRPPAPRPTPWPWVERQDGTETCPNNAASRTTGTAHTDGNRSGEIQSG